MTLKRVLTIGFVGFLALFVIRMLFSLSHLAFGWGHHGLGFGGRGGFMPFGGGAFFTNIALVTLILLVIYYGRKLRQGNLAYATQTAQNSRSAQVTPASTTVESTASSDMEPTADEAAEGTSQPVDEPTNDQDLVNLEEQSEIVEEEATAGIEAEVDIETPGEAGKEDATPESDKNVGLS